MREAVPSSVLPRGTVTVALVLVASTLAVLGITADPVVLTRNGIALGVATVGILIISIDALRSYDGRGLPWRSLILRNLGVALLLTPIYIRGGRPEPPESFAEGRTPELSDRSLEQNTFMATVDRFGLVLVILAAVGLLIYSGLLGLLVRRVRLLFATKPPGVAPGPTGDPVGDDAAARDRARSAALRRSAGALDDTDDHRQAVIAAYVALEQHLTAVTARRGSETAREYVSRALRSAATEQPHVSGLLDVFGSARYSARPVTADDVARARHHLQALVGG